MINQSLLIHSPACSSILSHLYPCASVSQQHVNKSSSIIRNITKLKKRFHDWLLFRLSYTKLRRWAHVDVNSLIIVTILWTSIAIDCSTLFCVFIDRSADFSLNFISSNDCLINAASLCSEVVRYLLFKLGRQFAWIIWWLMTSSRNSLCTTATAFQLCLQLGIARSYG